MLLSGEAGIGKSRIAQALRQRIAETPHLRMRLQCAPFYTGTALYPFISHIERAAGLVPEDSPEVKLDKIEELLAQSAMPVAEAAPLFAAQLSIPTGGRYATQEMTPQRLKEKILEALARQLEGLAVRQPVLMLFEDVHWADPTTLEALELIIDRVQGSRVLGLITFRPEFVSPWHGHTHVTALTLNRLSRDQRAKMVANVTGGKDLPDEVMDQIVAKTDGVPLFVEELTKTVVESGLLQDAGDRYRLAGPLPPLAIPSTLRDSLMARLDRLAPVKEVAQVGAAIGREFSQRLLAAVLSSGKEQLHQALGQLVDSELIFRRGSPPDVSYVFKHALVQDAAYDSLLRSRRQELHRQIAEVLEKRFPESAESEPEIIAHHYTEAGLIDPAITYWRRAGQRAAEKSANSEAVSHLNRALELLLTLPEGAERDSEELDMLVALTGPITGSLGYTAPETEQVYARARELCERFGESPKIFPVIFGWFSFYIAQGKAANCLELAEEFLRRADRLDDDTFRMIGHRLVGTGSHITGRLVPAIEHLDRAIAMYDVHRHSALALTYAHDVKVAALCIRGLVLWLLGYPDRAFELARRMAVDLAATLSHTSTKGYAHVVGATFLHAHFVEMTVVSVSMPR